ncbi:hypothetical protein RhiXN_04755 [Rhizoctonia solani]|uniref:Peptidase S8/S53 domain-containing protein n=1 Tax=Rhizoctonia solani TaxID=456999 RepID=A0A8H8SU52_9AGAM|nr:uncharacterized protein RhiXN_04755 [Rhizoctonia solani]QRW16753.1 hypothetical protein RhiXN_04755 [Rhizoctonia solani]
MKSFTLIAIALASQALAAPTLIPLTKLAGPAKGDSYVIKLKDGVSKDSHIAQLLEFIGNQDSESSISTRTYSTDMLVCSRALFSTTFEAPPRWSTSRLIRSIKSTGSKVMRIRLEGHVEDQTSELAKRAANGEGVDIYGLDTGILTSHESFGGRASWGATFGGFEDKDGNGHGTHTAGTAAGSGFGLATAAKLLPSSRHCPRWTSDPAIDSAVKAASLVESLYSCRRNENQNAGNSSPAHVPKPIPLPPSIAPTAKLPSPTLAVTVVESGLSVSTSAAPGSEYTAVNTISGTLASAVVIDVTMFRVLGLQEATCRVRLNGNSANFHTGCPVYLSFGTLRPVSLSEASATMSFAILAAALVAPALAAPVPSPSPSLQGLTPMLLVLDFIGSRDSKVVYKYENIFNGYAGTLKGPILDYIRHSPDVEYIEADTFSQIDFEQGDESLAAVRFTLRRKPLTSLDVLPTAEVSISTVLIPTPLVPRWDPDSASPQLQTSLLSRSVLTLAVALFPTLWLVLTTLFREPLLLVVHRCYHVLGFSPTTSLDNAVTSAIGRGIHFTVAAGNENQNAANVSPARVAAANTIGAIDSSNRKASFSNYGSALDVWALGVNVRSAWIGSNSAVNTISGTSMATPQVAGILAVVIGNKGNSSPAALASALRSKAQAVVTGAPSGTTNLKARVW